LFKKYFELSQEYGKQGSEHMYDQEIIFEILTKHHRFFNEHGKLVWGIYPTDFVKNGHLYWNEPRTGRETVVHVNFTIGERDKTNKLKTAGLWFVEEKEIIS